MIAEDEVAKSVMTEDEIDDFLRRFQLRMVMARVRREAQADLILNLIQNYGKFHIPDDSLLKMRFLPFYG